MREKTRSRAGRNRGGGPIAAVMAFGCLLMLLPVYSRDVDPEPEPSVSRTIKLKIAIDEEFRSRPGNSVLEMKKTVAAAIRFFRRHFGVPIEIQEIVRWRSDNTKWTLEELCDDLYVTVERGGSDIVIGFSGQIRGESKVFGVASYDQGYILMKRSMNSYISKVILTHELCHVFGAVDLEMEASIMNEERPQFECDDFTKEVVHLHRNRRFGRDVFPLPPEGLKSAISVYEKRKSLRRREPGVSLRLATLYLQLRDSEKAIRECLEAERIAPDDPAIRILLELAYRQKAEAGSDRPTRPFP